MPGNCVSSNECTYPVVELLEDLVKTRISETISQARIARQRCVSNFEGTLVVLGVFVAQPLRILGTLQRIDTPRRTWCVKE